MHFNSTARRCTSRWLPRALLALAGVLAAGLAHAGVTLYEHDGFRGRAVTINSRVPNLKANGFNDIASSAYVDNGTWLVCEDDNFRGRCVVLQPGSYGSLESLGMQDNITSVRPYRRGEGNWDAAPPQGAPNYGYYRRPNEQVFEAPVTSVRAISGTGEQRCWYEQQAVPGSGNPNVGAAIIGGIIGGVLGHQVGSGRGNDAATAAGAVAGAAIGANAGGGSLPYSRNVRRCENVGGQASYYEVTYNFRGQDHYIQMSYPPGRTILVNRLGEPRQ
ncbi:MAG TPA: beta/gamma crystallin family protein [Casimicrobium huifangae]|jgi:uncharacterized protein YcfJ|uniref:beta/gamma crystallin family protein n=1 Tax=Casimicrobium huifangae TaxID=2591109 RepID=UPI0012EB467D|nr:beta/gamma crystallin family protein [Casimicrobium huifangae]HOB01834.1 beta/gamma crystallin family protein [Casimicrobium huifangae]HQA33433.1 beta/gamma crystallin family protein [Casimicrobium huifangae]HQD65638.1 beta/gamma crystallin family protein [Casimicrobium huifangae]